jgi:prophage maintenance system killer protein
MRKLGLAPYVCDQGKLEAALLRPVHHELYVAESSDLELGARLAVSIAVSHSFVDGNKRTAYAVLSLYLKRNGFRLRSGKQDRTIFRQIEQAVIDMHTSEDSGESTTQRLAQHLQKVVVHRQLGLW